MRSAPLPAKKQIAPGIIPLWYSPINMTENFPSLWSPIVTALVAVYAAILSTFNLIWNLWRVRRRLKVTLTIGATPYGPEIGQPSVLLCAVNPGSRAVTVSEFGLRLPKGKELVGLKSSFQHDSSLPHELVDGGTHRAWLLAERLAVPLNKFEHLSGEVKLRGFYRSTLWKQYESETLSFRIEDYLPHQDK